MGDWSEDEFPQSKGPQGKEPQREKPQDMKQHDEDPHGMNPQEEGSSSEGERSSGKWKAPGKDFPHDDSPRDQQPQEEVRWDERLSREIARREQQIREIWQRRRHKLNALRDPDNKVGEMDKSAGPEEKRTPHDETEGHAWRSVLGDALHWQGESRENAEAQGGLSESAHNLRAEEQDAHSERTAEEWRGDEESTIRDHLAAKAQDTHSNETESVEPVARERKWRGILQNTLLEDQAAEDFSEGGGAAPRGPRVPRVLIRIGGGKVFSRVAIVLLLLCSIAVGAAAGLLFVYSSDLPQIQELENYRPDVVTEVYADDGSSIGSFALQRRILLTYEQIPKALRDAIISTEDRHFMDHWGIDFPRVAEAAWTDMMHRRVIQGASTITMQLAGGLFLNRADRSFRRKIEEAMLAVQIERHYTKQQIFTMYCNQVYL